MREYIAVIWIDDKPGKRIRVQAESLEAARRAIEDEYGPGHLVTLYNEDDAERPGRDLIIGTHRVPAVGRSCRSADGRCRPLASVS